MSNSIHQYYGTAQAAMFLGGLIGFTEASWLLYTTGAPDMLSPFYAVVLYGLIGRMFGKFTSLAIIVIKPKRLENKQLGAAALSTFIPMGGFILFYQIRKVVFAEQMPPIWALGLILLSIAALCALGFVGSLNRFFTTWRSTGLFVLLALFSFISWKSQATQNAAFQHDFGKPVPQSLQDKPNVIFLLIDTLRADHVNAYGKIDIRTPNMDALAKDGLLFEQCYAQASWTRPSGVSMFSSRIPSGHSTQIKAAAAPNEAEFFTEVLQKSGVTTAGLANNINLTATFNLDQGYDAFMYTEPKYPLWGSESVFGLTFYKVLEKLLDKIKSNNARSVYNYYQPATVLFDYAKSFLEKNKNSRWMLYLHLMEPHDPYFAHPVLSGGTEEYSGEAYGRKGNETPDPADLSKIKDLYRQEVEYMDQKIGHFIEWLKTEELYENTMIILVSDHGEEFMEHGHFWHGTSLYDEVLHVPLIIKTPQKGIKDKRIPWQVRSIDIAPTITSALGLESPAEWEGKDLIGDATIKELQNPTQNLSEDCNSKREYKSDLDRIVIAENNFEGNILSSIRMRSFKYILANENNPRGLAKEELYDVQSDVSEQNNQIGQTGSICDQSIPEHTAILKAVLGETLNEALQNAVQSEGVELDAATVEKMRALGYMK
ncbi:MAG: sulfatase [Myxococcota bacterium]|nr:sulfatase [Myxococcota bacterium]